MNEQMKTPQECIEEIRAVLKRIVGYGYDSFHDVDKVSQALASLSALEESMKPEERRAENGTGAQETGAVSGETEPDTEAICPERGRGVRYEKPVEVRKR